MSVLVRTAGVTVLGFAFVACGGGAGGDGGAIKDVFRRHRHQACETTAEALPEGTTTVGGQEFRLDDANDPEYASLTKEDGEWKLADCSILI